MEEITKKINIGRIFFIYALFALLSGCATAPPPEDVKVFYPSPPDLPKLQYLTSFTGADDIEEDKSAFDTFITGQETGLRRLLKPYGVSMHNGKIYVCDTNLTVTVFDVKNKKYTYLQGAKGLGKLVQPLNINIDPEGKKYVADPLRGQIVVYDDNDFYVKSYGLPGNWRPVDAYAFKGRLYVADAENYEIKVFDLKSGQLVKIIGKRGEIREQLGIPTNITIDDNGKIYVTDVGRFQIVMYDLDGHYLGKIGDAGQNPGYFARPRGVEVDNEGKIYAVDAAFDNVQIFNQNGQLLLFFGGAGYRPGNLFLPAAIHIDYDPNNIELFREYIDPNFEVEFLVIVISQFGDRLVNVYGAGRERGVEYPSDEELMEQLKEKMETWQEAPPEGQEQPTQ